VLDDDDGDDPSGGFGPSDDVDAAASGFLCGVGVDDDAGEVGEGFVGLLGVTPCLAMRSPRCLQSAVSSIGRV
jgi:hypothetical protein